MTIKVLITGAGALLGQGIIKALKMSTLQVDLVAADPSIHSAGLYWTNRAYTIPMARDPNYIGRLVDILSKERPDAVLVGTDVELPLLAAHRAELERSFGTHVLVSSPEVVAVADDKHRTAAFFRDRGFGYPETALPDNADGLIDRIGFPLIVKPRTGARAVGVSKARSREELRAALTGRGGLVIQECVGSDDDEYTAGAVVFDGRCQATIVMRRELRDGNTYRAFIEPFPELNALVARWATSLNPYGPANFQFRIGADGVAKVFEINARFSGTTPLRALVGFHEVEMCLRYILFGETISQPAVEPAMILRHWSETLVRASDLARVQ